MPSQTCAKAPCKSCPYRQDVPSGVWDISEYAKLPRYDGSLVDQMLSGASVAFDCHQQDGNLCAGWIAAHGAENLLSLRMIETDEHVWTFESPVPVWGSGAEAAEHGVRDIDCPPPEAVAMMASLIKKRARRD